MQLTKEQEEKILTVIQSPQVLKKIFEALYPIAIEPRKTPSKYNLEFLAVGASTVFNVNTYPSIKTTAWIQVFASDSRQEFVKMLYCIDTRVFKENHVTVT